MLSPVSGLRFGQGQFGPVFREPVPAIGSRVIITGIATSGRVSPWCLVAPTAC